MRSNDVDEGISNSICASSDTGRRGRGGHLKGQVALDREGRVVGPGDMRAQTQKALENIRAILGTMGGSAEDVLSLVHYVTDIEAFMAVGDIRRQFFGRPYPVTTTVQVVRLYRRDLVIEIAAMAEIPFDRFCVPTVVSEP